MGSRYQEVQRLIRQRRRRWLITGVAGFIGSHLLEALLKLDQAVVGLDNYATGYARNLEEVQEAAGAAAWRNFTFIEGDIRAIADCRRACAGVNLVLHHAALGSVPRSVEDPLATHESNLTGFVNMLVAARDTGEARHEYGLELEPWDALPRADAVVVAVAHRQFVARPLADYFAKVIDKGCFIDVKSQFDMTALQRAGLTVWRL